MHAKDSDFSLITNEAAVSSDDGEEGSFRFELVSTLEVSLFYNKAERPRVEGKREKQSTEFSFHGFHVVFLFLSLVCLSLIEKDKHGEICMKKPMRGKRQ
ncbi:uncharacterized protein DS421_15g502990 [Arachis hypogaea]|nr:uncharacterized protein DS421_15g502990 [Arachis hypogaea]